MNRGVRWRPHPSSSTTFGVRNEDTQPNEDIHKRASDAPPVLQETAKVPAYRRRDWKQERYANQLRHPLPQKPTTNLPNGVTTPQGPQNVAGPSTLPRTVSSFATVSSRKSKSIASSHNNNANLKRHRASYPQPSTVSNSFRPSSSVVLEPSLSARSHGPHPPKRRKLDNAQPSIRHLSPAIASNSSSTRSEPTAQIKTEREATPPLSRTPIQQRTRAKTPPPPPIALKLEPDLSPVIPLPLKPRTSGTKFYPGLPKTLWTGHPDCAENRNEWIKQTKTGLVGKIRFHRVLFRQDGICIDWTSKVPRMPDTLEPFYEPVEDDEIAVVDPPTAGGHEVVVEPTQTFVPELRPPSPVEPAISGISERAPSPDSVPRLPTLEGLSPPGSEVAGPPVIETVVNIDRLFTDAEVFLEKYIKAFDMDRSSLGSAYSRLCTLSCKVHRPTRTGACNSSEAISGLFSSIEPGLKGGRLDVMSALVSIDPRFKFCPPRSKQFDLDFNMGWDCIVGRMCLNCYGELLYEKERIGVDMSFVLGETDADAEDGSSGLWTPLVIVAQQITVRDVRTFYY